MEHKRVKISDPDYAHLSVARLNELCTNATSQPDLSRQISQPSIADRAGTTRAVTRAASGTIDAADILDHFCTFDREKPRLASIKTERDTPVDVVPAVQSLNEAYTLKEAAQLLNLNWRSILGLVAVGQLATVENGDASLWLDGKSLQAFRESDAVRSVEPTREVDSHVNTTGQQDIATVSPGPILGVTEEEFSVEPLDAPSYAVQSSTTAQIDIHELVEKLSEAQAQLEAASYRIGVLESELASSEHKVKLLPDLQNHELRLSALERENRSLRHRLEELEQAKSPSLIDRLLSLVKWSRPGRKSTDVAVAAEPPPLNFRRPRRDFR